MTVTKAFFCFPGILKEYVQFRLGMIYLSSKVRKYKKGKGKQPMIKIDDWVIEKGEKAQGKIKTQDTA